MKTILMWISGISLLAGATFTMALFRGDRIRGVYSSEEMSNRPLRLKMGGTCLLLGIIFGSGPTPSTPTIWAPKLLSEEHLSDPTIINSGEDSAFAEANGTVPRLGLSLVHLRRRKKETVTSIPEMSLDKCQDSRTDALSSVGGLQPYQPDVRDLPPYVLQTQVADCLLGGLDKDQFLRSNLACKRGSGKIRVHSSAGPLILRCCKTKAYLIQLSTLPSRSS